MMTEKATPTVDPIMCECGHFFYDHTHMPGGRCTQAGCRCAAFGHTAPQAWTAEPTSRRGTPSKARIEVREQRGENYCNLCWHDADINAAIELRFQGATGQGLFVVTLCDRHQRMTGEALLAAALREVRAIIAAMAGPFPPVSAWKETAFALRDLAAEALALLPAQEEQND